MKLIGLMLCHHDDWIIGMSARAALKWCDALVILNLGSEGKAAEILDKLSGEESSRVFLVENSDPIKFGIISPYEIMVKKARELQGTHIAIVRSYQVLSSNLIAQVRSIIGGIGNEQFLSLPVFYCWKSFMQYRTDKTIWSGTTVPFAYKDAPSLQWPPETGYDKFLLPRGKTWNLHYPAGQISGGMMSLEPVNWRFYKARYYLRQMIKLIKKDTLSGKPKLEKFHGQVVDETGIKLTKIPSKWWEEYFDLFSHVLPWKMPWYETEISRLRAENPPNFFSSIDLPGEVIDTPVDLTREVETARTTERRVPIVYTSLGKTKPAEAPSQKAVPLANPVSLFWSGHFYDYSGYGKASREILFRASNSVHISLYGQELNAEPIIVEPVVKARVDLHRSNPIRANSPYLRFFGPRTEKHPGYKVCFTMMETYGIHNSMTALLNGYNEVWVPTAWNKKIFEGGGVKVPVRTMPLGVNTQLYSPGPKQEFRPLRLITTADAGQKEVPKGFLFINVSNPSFRKGIDVMVKAFDDAFKGDPGAALILCVSYSSLVHCNPFELIPGGKDACKSKIYVLDGGMSEDEMVGTFRNCDAYVTASRGEGWNLPLMEAAACGLPVIAPNAFSHHEFLREDNCFLFTPDRQRTIKDAEKISEWYKDQLFADYGPESIMKLSELMRVAKEAKVLREQRAQALRSDILSKYTWDKVTEQFVSRVIELNRM